MVFRTRAPIHESRPGVAKAWQLPIMGTWEPGLGILVFLPPAWNRVVVGYGYILWGRMSPLAVKRADQGHPQSHWA